MATGIEHVLPVLQHLRRAEGSSALAEVGRVVALSPTHAQRVIARLAGESPDRYQRRLRLERAAALLLSTDQRVIDIALAVGFDSHEAFSRAFRRHFATTPTRYRRRPGVRLSAEEARRVDPRAGGHQFVTAATNVLRTQRGTKTGKRRKENG
ncbi:MAG: helix-turn-helix transcriptional regulator, partial [Actinomycetota bacterium]